MSIKQIKKAKYRKAKPSYPSENDFRYEKSTFENEYEIPTNRKIRIYCDGVYDLFHYGHARSLQQAKNLFPNVFLIVGVTSDKMTRELKGETVMNEKERAESLKHCKYVDMVIENCPWVITEEFMQKHKIDFVCHDEHPYSSSDESVKDIYEFVKTSNRFIPTKRTIGISTSNIITMIVKDYDQYVRRNLERGVKPKELNLSFILENKYKMKKNLEKLENEINKEIESVKTEFKVALEFWEQRSNNLMKKFIDKFGKSDGNFWKQLKNLVSNSD